MTKNIYSKIQPDLLLHVVNQANIPANRQDLCPDTEYIQISCFTLPNHKTFRPHRHITNIRKTIITQESWIVISGKIKAILYDLDDTIITEEILSAGDCSITFQGGHNYECLEDNTQVYEVKTGPYFGQEKDKTFI